MVVIHDMDGSYLGTLDSGWWEALAAAAALGVTPVSSPPVAAGGPDAGDAVADEAAVEEVVEALVAVLALSINFPLPHGIFSPT